MAEQPTATTTATPATTTPQIEESKPLPTIPDPPKNWFWGTGRRKTSVARVRIKPGDGKYFVNERELNNYFPSERDRETAYAPLKATETLGRVDVHVTVKGGGTTGQAGAIQLGLGRALKTANPDYVQLLRDGGHLTRDSRMVERKKYGQAGARKRFQFSKR